MNKRDWVIIGSMAGAALLGLIVYGALGATGHIEYDPK